jgi:hypothetical protein
MKKLILAVALLSISAGAFASSYECKISTLKPTIGSLATNSYYDNSYRMAYWLDASLACSSEGACSLIGNIRRTMLRVFKDGKEAYMGTGLELVPVSISGAEKQDLLLTDEYSESILRVQCK